jgi:hypothetical protein
MATVSTIRLSVDLLDCAFVDSLDPRFLYRDSPYQIALTVKNGEAGLSTGIKLYDEDGEYLDLAGTATAADGTATITIDDEIDFDGAYTCLICVNGSKAAEFPLEVRAIGSPVPPTGTVLDWNVITSYVATATHGPVRPHSGTLEVKATNADGSISIGVKDGLYDPAGSAATVAGNLTAHIDDTTAAHAATAISNTPAGGIAATTVQAAINELDTEKLAVGGTAADVNPAGTSIAAALLAKANDNAVVKLIGSQTITGFKTFTSRIDAPGVEPTADNTQKLGGNTFAKWSWLEGWITTLYTQFLRAATASGLALQDSAGAEHALLTSTGLRIRPRIVSSSITAELDGVYHGTAAATYTDPTPAEGRGFVVRVVNGTQTVGGTAYAAEGTVIFREYHSGSWRNRVLFGGADAAGVRTNIEAGRDAGTRVATMTGDETLTTSSATVQILDPNANRNLDLPNGADFVVKNTGAAGEIITVRDAADATIDAVDPGVTLTFRWNGTGWTVLG